MKKSLGQKQNEMTQKHIEKITDLFLNFSENEDCKVLDNSDFGYTESFKRDNAMRTFKDSGIEWLGEIPEHWEVVPIRCCFNESNIRCNESDYSLLSVTIVNGVIYQNDIANKKDISNNDKSSYKIVPLNAVAYNKMRMWQGAVGVNMLGKGIVSPAYIVAIPNKQITSIYSFIY